jgi:alginate O-acetyltransferase complex protein AlgI
MVFSSLLFLFLFLPLCLLVYYLSPSRTAKNIVLTLFSLIFYAWGEPIWVSLLIFSALIDYANGMFIERFRGQAIAKLGLYSTFVINLGLLASFKYADFIVDNINFLTGLSFEKPGLLLPIGISFYTFQTISYTIDVWKGEVKAQRSFLNFLLFVSCFHQLVAGPIVRYSHMAAEIEHRVFHLHDFSEGVNRFCQGLFKKVFVANVAGEICLQFMGKDPAQLSLAGSWLGLVMFSLQIYFDFSGYSDMAIGLGKMFGFYYHENFKYPYTSRSVTDFWRRWHISLGTFFRDYVYIPLGGNRHHPIRNIFIVWALTGLWHGASWNFVLWGLYFGVLLFLEKSFLLALLERLPRGLQHLYALFFIVLGWAIFYFTDVQALAAYLKVMFGLTPAELSNYEVEATLWGHVYWMVLAFVLCTPWVHQVFHRLLQGVPAPFTGVLMTTSNVVLLGTSTVLLVGQSYNPFIYFRF